MQAHSCEMWDMMAILTPYQPGGNFLRTALKSKPLLTQLPFFPFSFREIRPTSLQVSTL